MTLRAEPLIRPVGVVLIAIGVMGIMAASVIRDNWIGLVVSSLVLLFILGADVTAMIRAWRGVPEPPERQDPVP